MKPETRQEIAARLVCAAEVMVARQQDLVIYLACNGHKTDQATRLLRNFEVALKNFRSTLAMLEARANAPSSGPSSPNRDTGPDTASDPMSKEGRKPGPALVRDADQDAEDQLLLPAIVT